ncbi:MAG: RdgB/HAM1 family non-canonical purine NTP pyrophosphatase [Bacilli bacterium]|nr:RdgB/HAM1 family non-canonical purine NTP pyrophosphatase [Bacilli bacterium]MBN2877405.1 RdgB/HAM1 family non-canonical purine NTP pyrophosphatase [Bacilli bacterium]
MKQLIIATHNKNKLNEIKALLDPLGIQCLSLDDINWVDEIEEIGKTFFENAMIKAKTVAKQTGIPTLGDDSGLLVDAFPGLLGVRSKRFSKEATHDANNALLLQMMEDIENRSARFMSDVVLYFPDDSYKEYIGTVEGAIARDYMGENGFGYDPVFIIKETGKRMAELTQKEKNQISHRGRALHKLIEDIQNETIVI